MIVIVGIVALLAGGIGAYGGAMLAAGTIALKLSEMTTHDGRTTRKTTNTVD